MNYSRRVAGLPVGSTLKLPSYQCICFHFTMPDLLGCVSVAYGFQIMPQPARFYGSLRRVKMPR